MQFDILTIFPEIIKEYCSKSVLGRGQKNKAISIKAHNFRDFSKDKHNKVDDKPYGGGPGMVLQVQPIFDCLKKIKAIEVLKGKKVSKVKTKGKKTKIVIMDPAGKKFDQRMAEKFAKLDRLILICGRYEGFDERIYKLADEKISVGDYVLAGGELPALTITEAVSRLVPNVLGNEESLKEETHSSTMLRVSDNFDKQKRGYAEYPQYTRPEDFLGWKVPKVLLSGDHKKIEEWRKGK